jgi:hypothetical protein
MCRIVINTDQLAETAVLLRNAAGEYQAIGANVAGCNCGCMPADVAAVVDGVTAAVRSGLHGVAGELATQAGDVSTRAGVDQSGGAGTMSIGGFGFDPAWSASGGGTISTGGFGFDPSWSASGGGTISTGGFGFDPAWSASGSGTMMVGGYGLPYLVDSGGGGSNLIIGGNDFGLGNSGGGANLIIGGNDFGLGNSGGGGGGLVIGGTNLFSPDTGGGMTLTIYPEPLPELTLGPTGDPFLDDIDGWLERLRPASRNLAASGFRFNGPTITDVTDALANVNRNIIGYGTEGRYVYNYGEHSNFFIRPGEIYGTRV